METFSKPFLILLIFLVASISGSGYEVELQSGEVKQDNISSQELSGKWIGISGNSTRFSQGVSDTKVGELTFDNSQAGEVVETDLKGLSGGGYYLALTPYIEEVKVSELSELDSGDLQKNGIFREEDFPVFYPDYENITDTPDETFTGHDSVMLENQHFNASEAVLSSGIELYLLKYSSNGTDMPVFVAPIDGKKFGSGGYSSCYDGGACGFEFILPRVDAEDNPYGINFWSSGQPVQSCSEVDYNGSTYVKDGALSESQGSCINMTVEDTAVDLLHQTVSGSGECGVRMQADNQNLRGGAISGFETGVCTNTSSSSSMDEIEMDVDTAITATNSNLTARDLNSLSGTLVNSSNSTVNLGSVGVGGVEVTGEYQDLDLKPSDISQQVKDETELTPLNISIELESKGDSNAENPGFYYPPVNDTGVEPTDILHIKQNNGSYTVEEMNDIKIDLDGERMIFKEGTVDSFSYFAVFGEKVDKDEVVEEEVVEEVVEERVVEETVSAPPPPPQPTPNPTPILLDIVAENKTVNITRGNVVEATFTLENYGDVETGDFFVGSNLPDTWATVSEPVESLSSGESEQVNVLLEASSDVEVGSYSYNFQAFRNRSTFDIEELKINVRPAEDDRDLDILSAPTYIRSEPGESHTIGLLAENSGPLNLEDIEIGFRNLEDCGSFNTDSGYSVEGESKETLRFDYTASENPETCTGVVTLRNQGEILAFQPLNLDVTEPPSRNSPIVLPLILVFWTAITIYEVFV
jgi:hypothetical protein